MELERKEKEILKQQLQLQKEKEKELQYGLKLESFFVHQPTNGPLQKRNQPIEFQTVSAKMTSYAKEHLKVEVSSAPYTKLSCCERLASLRC